MSGSAPARSAAVLAGAAVLLATVSACGTASARTTAPRPFLSVRQAAAIQLAYDNRNNQVNKSYDSRALSAIETSPQRAVSRATLTADKELKQAIPDITSSGTTFFIPATTTYPRWFLSAGIAVAGGVPTPRPVYTIFTQRSPHSPWRVAYDVEPAGTVPALATSPTGAATARADARNLALTPADLGGAIFAHYTKPPARDVFAYSAALDGELTAGYRVGVESAAGHGWRLTRRLDSATAPTYLLTTTDGGALAFTASVVTDTLRPSHGAGTVTLSAGSAEAAVAGLRGGLTGRRLLIRREQTFLTYIPLRSSRQQPMVLGYTDTPVSVSGAHRLAR